MWKLCNSNASEAICWLYSYLRFEEYTPRNVRKPCNIFFFNFVQNQKCLSTVHLVHSNRKLHIDSDFRKSLKNARTQVLSISRQFEQGRYHELLDEMIYDWNETTPESIVLKWAHCAKPKYTKYNSEWFDKVKAISKW